MKKLRFTHVIERKICNTDSNRIPKFYRNIFTLFWQPSLPYRLEEVIIIICLVFCNIWKLVLMPRACVEDAVWQSDIIIVTPEPTQCKMGSHSHDTTASGSRFQRVLLRKLQNFG
jgi:hypothetical protein